MSAIRDGWSCRDSIGYLLVFCSAVSSPILLSAQHTTRLKLEPHTIHLKGKGAFPLFLPKGFAISPAAEGLKRVRFMAKSPDGRIFVTTLHDLSDNSAGSVYILDGFDEKSASFARVIPYLSNLRNPNSIAFYRDQEGQDWFYVALTDRLLRYKFTPGQESPSSPPHPGGSSPECRRGR